MSFKCYFLSRAFVALLFGGAKSKVQILGIMRNIYLKSFFFYLDQCFGRRCRLKIYHVGLWLPFSFEEGNHLCNYTTGQYEKYLLKIILNLDQWAWRKRCLKIYLI